MPRRTQVIDGREYDVPDSLSNSEVEEMIRPNRTVLDSIPPGSTVTSRRTMPATVDLLEHERAAIRNAYVEDFTRTMMSSDIPNITYDDLNVLDSIEVPEAPYISIDPETHAPYEYHYVPPILTYSSDILPSDWLEAQKDPPKVKKPRKAKPKHAICYLDMFGIAHAHYKMKLPIPDTIEMVAPNPNFNIKFINDISPKDVLLPPDYVKLTFTCNKGTPHNPGPTLGYTYRLTKLESVDLGTLDFNTVKTLSWFREMSFSPDRGNWMHDRNHECEDVDELAADVGLFDYGVTAPASTHRNLGFTPSESALFDYTIADSMQPRTGATAENPRTVGGPIIHPARLEPADTAISNAFPDYAVDYSGSRDCFYFTSRATGTVTTLTSWDLVNFEHDEIVAILHGEVPSVPIANENPRRSGSHWGP